MRHPKSEDSFCLSSPERTFKELKTQAQTNEIINIEKFSNKETN